MGETNVTLAVMADGWHTYQTQLSEALAPLTAEQLALRPAPHQRSIEELARHIIGVRAGWFHMALGEGEEEFGAYRTWDRADGLVRTASALVQGLDATWQGMQAALAHFTPEDLLQELTRERDGRLVAFRRGWVVWHVLEHDLHHGVRSPMHWVCTGSRHQTCDADALSRSARGPRWCSHAATLPRL